MGDLLSLKAHRAYLATRNLPRSVLRDLAEDLHQATWCDGSWHGGWFSLSAYRNSILLVIAEVPAPFEFTIDEALSLVALLVTRNNLSTEETLAK